MKLPNRKVIFLFLISQLLPFVSYVFQSLAWDYIKPFAWFLFYPTVFASSAIGGFNAGVIATISSIVLVWFNFLPLQENVSKNIQFLWPMFTFLLTGIAFSVFHNRLKKTNETLSHSLEKNIKLNEDLELSNRIMSHFFANVNHELRTTLTLVLSPIQKLLKSNLNSTERHSLEISYRNGQSLLKHLSDLLEMANLEAGKTRTYYSNIDLIEIISEISSKFQIITQEKRIEFLLNTPIEFPIQTDAEILIKILTNLLSNAFKFTPVGGKVVLNLNWENEKKYFKIEISDSGPGIALEFRKTIFEPFFQIEDSLVRKFGGTGLGLTIVKEYVDLLHGKIEVDTSPTEGGSRFTVILPTMAPLGTTLIQVNDKDYYQLLDHNFENNKKIENESNVIDISSAKFQNQPTILIVEDNPDLNNFIGEILSDDFHIAAAYNGEEGLNMIQKINPDVILTDIMMPKMSGIQMISEIRKNEKYQDVPIIVLSARADENLKVELLESGVQDYIEKPFLVDDILARVRNHANTHAINEKIRNSEAKFRGLLESAQDAIIIFNQSGVIEFVNNQLTSWFQCSREELIGQSTEKILPNYKHILKLKNKNSQDQNTEFMAIRKDGTEFPAEIVISEMSTPVGPLFTAMIRDIKVRKQKEAQLNFLSSTNRMLAETLDYDLTIKKTANLIVPEISDACIIRVLNESGFPQTNEVIHKNFELQNELSQITNFMNQNLIILDGIKWILKYKEPKIGQDYVTEEFQKHNLNTYFKNSLDKLKIKSYAMIPLIAHGKIQGTVTFLQGESKRVFSEKDLPFLSQVGSRIASAMESSILYQDAKKSLNIRENLLNIVSHDLKNPLSSIQLTAELISKYNKANSQSMSPQFIEKQEQLLHRILNNVDVMSHLIHDLLDQAAMQAGRLTINSKTENISEIIQTAMDLFKSQLDLKKLKINKSILTENFELNCDKKRIIQAISNLLGNAIKFSTEGGQIEIQVTGDKKEIHVVISDEGPGIPADSIPYIFDQFWQAEKTKHLGTGLGLSIAKGIITAHRGKIWVDSQLGIGSQFHFTLPTQLKKESLEYPPSNKSDEAQL